jgi:DNA invertase Pin-like site-specific DNA recombinase
MKAVAGRRQRCAIYTRVSTDNSLEQEFNSLDAQRQAAQAYVKSQTHEGWTLIRDRYDDGGFSGGALDRPALQKLLVDIRERRVDIVVVYKVDRLTRSLADFAKLVELFDAHGVTFVSVTQSFNTTSSMGRLTLNVLLSFAQFEREVTGERIRDKIAACKKKGLWVGGVPPLGYEVQDRKLVVNEEEAANVRLIFARCIDLGSLSALQQELRQRGIVTRKRTLSSGRAVGGRVLTSGPLAYILRNRMYLGEINHRDKSYPGQHTPIIATDLFEAAQAKLSEKIRERRGRRRSSNALLVGKLFDDRGNLMTPSYAVKERTRYRCYVSSAIA